MLYRSLKTTLLTALVLLGTQSFAQVDDQDVPKQLDLQTCIQIALDKNLDIKRTRNDALIATSNYEQSRFEYFPDLNFSVNYGFANGLLSQNATGNAVNASTNSSSPSVSANVPIYNGGQIKNNRDRSRLVLDQSNFDIDNSIDNTEIAITGFYLQVLMSKENIKISEERIKLLEGQLERAEKRVELGVENNQQVFNLQSQIANERLNLVTVKNTFAQNKLLLLQQLLLDPTQEYEIIGVQIDEDQIRDEALPYRDYYSKAEEYSPSLKSAELGIDISKKDFELAKANKKPNLNGQLSYSSQYFAILDQESPGFFEQMEENRQFFAGVRLNVPIFNRNRVNNNMQVARINMDNANLAVEQAEIDLHNRLQQAYLDLLTALSTYNASIENFEALDQAFKFSETSYKSGNADFYSYIEALNNKNRAELELNNAKYSIVFRKRILDILSGNS
jgi:outer membrane protein